MRMVHYSKVASINILYVSESSSSAIYWQVMKPKGTFQSVILVFSFHEKKKMIVVVGRVLVRSIVQYRSQSTLNTFSKKVTPSIRVKILGVFNIQRVLVVPTPPMYARTNITTRGFSWKIFVRRVTVTIF